MMLKNSFSRSSSLIAISIACAVTLSSCAKDLNSTGSIGKRGQNLEQLSVTDLNQASSRLAKAYERKKGDKATGLQFAKALKLEGRNEQALAVMQQMVIAHPTDNDVLSAYGKALAATGNFKKALKVIERAQRPDSPDWRLYSAKGAILDQIDQPKLARAEYRKALDMVPYEPSVLSNLGMSYVLSGDLRSAETYLRKAIKQPKASSRVRQNLALVVGLQGNFEQAEKIARGELGPKAAEENITFLRTMLSQQNAWNLLKNTDQPKKAQ